MHQYYGNMENENIKFTDESGVMMSECSDELRSFVATNIIQKITGDSVPDDLDECGRPLSFTVEHDGIKIKVKYVYIYDDISNWACSNYQIFIL